MLNSCKKIEFKTGQWKKERKKIQLPVAAVENCASGSSSDGTISSNGLLHFSTKKKKGQVYSIV